MSITYELVSNRERNGDLDLVMNAIFRGRGSGLAE
jgi:hypothetical protein